MKMRVVLAIMVLSASVCWAGQKADEAQGTKVAAKQAKTEAKILDPAAKLKGLQWIKGGPVELKKGSFYVVEFWATWCPPCRVSIPHLTKLQAKFKDKHVTFIGVSNETADKVKPFVEKQGDNMNYVVAIDPKRKVSDGYMKAYKQGGIPTAFIVDKELRIVWYGHPMSDLEQVLEKVIAGKFDAKAYEAKRELERKKNAAAMKAFHDYFVAIRSKDGAKDAEAAGKLILENGSSLMLNAFAWRVLTEVPDAQQDPALALEAATKASKMEEGKNAAVLDTLGLALFKNGKVDEAIETQKKAIKLAGDDEKMKKEFQGRLDEYQKAAKEK